MNYFSALRAAYHAWRADLDRQQGRASRIRALCESEFNTEAWLQRVSLPRLRLLAHGGHRWAQVELQRRGKEAV